MAFFNDWHRCRGTLRTLQIPNPCTFHKRVPRLDFLDGMVRTKKPKVQQHHLCLQVAQFAFLSIWIVQDDVRSLITLPVLAVFASSFFGVGVWQIHGSGRLARLKLCLIFLK